MKKINILAALVCLSLPLAAQAKGNAEAGKVKYEATCKACHGEAAAKPTLPEYPILAGQHRDYLAAVLNQYKAGKRKNALMNGFAAALKAEDIQDLAAYISSQPSNLRYKY
jgi:cytochrome c553